MTDTPLVLISMQIRSGRDKLSSKRHCNKINIKFTKMYPDSRFETDEFVPD